MGPSVSCKTMMGDTKSLTAWFEILPVEILSMIVGLLCNGDAKSLSLVCGKLRELALPYIFHRVRFEFSHSGFNALRQLLLSDLRQYVVSFTYVTSVWILSLLTGVNFMVKTLILVLLQLLTGNVKEEIGVTLENRVGRDLPHSIKPESRTHPNVLNFEHVIAPSGSTPSLVKIREVCSGETSDVSTEAMTTPEFGTLWKKADHFRQTRVRLSLRILCTRSLDQ
ncbi:hypothetical protein N7451_012078 [Penicillium sp. IBT 35674x]|nr:hypothetical protein N7451_012078 [Penicillium sp. IBT 35674x]